MADLLVADDITKHFGGVQALRGVSLRVEERSVHALVGENGAGKSTFGKIVAGLYRPDGGSLSVSGHPVKFRSPRDALLEAGITIVGQERAVIPQRTVIENVFLGRESSSVFLNRRETARAYTALVERTGFRLRGDAKVGSLRLSDQLEVEILRALVRDARLIVMDEVTAALTSDESERVFEVVRSLRDEGRSVLYISHFLEEVLSLADRVTVFRDGVLVRTSAAANETPSSLVSAMIGRPLELTFPEKRPAPPDASVVLSVERLVQSRAASEVSFEVRSGEIVGLAGLIGSGRSELARAIFGAERKLRGTVRIEGKEINVTHPRQAINAGIALLPESRKEEGLLMGRSIVENVSLVQLARFSKAGFVQSGRERHEAIDMIHRLDVRTAGPDIPVERLSGGNQQKVLFAKWLLRTPRLLIADEPTRGVDVGAKHAIYELLARLASEGMAVLLISSELEEVLGLSHRILVMRLGAIVAEFSGSEATEESVMRAAFAAEAA